MFMDDYHWCDFFYIISWDDYDKEMCKDFESRFDPENYEGQNTGETASMRHSEMLRAYAEAS